MPTPTAIANLIENFQIARDDVGRVTVTQSLHAKDLPGATPLEQLSYAFANYVPPFGALLGDFPVVVLCMGASVKAWGTADAEILITYRSPDLTVPRTGNQGQIEIGTTLTASQTDFDAENQALPVGQRQAIEVSYTPPAAGAVTRTAPARAAMLAPRSTLVIERTESAQPGAASRSYVGVTNSQPWNGADANTYLCTSITGRSSDGGITYVVTYTFEYDPVSNFRSVVFWEDPITRTRPVLSAQDIADGNGIAWVTVYGSADFNELGLI